MVSINAKWRRISNDNYDEAKDCIHVEGFKTEKYNEKAVGIVDVYVKRIVYLDRDGRADIRVSEKIFEAKGMLQLLSVL